MIVQENARQINVRVHKTVGLDEQDSRAKSAYSYGCPIKIYTTHPHIKTQFNITYTIHIFITHSAVKADGISVL